MAEKVYTRGAGEGEGGERLIAMTTLTYTAHFDDGVEELSAVAVLIEVDDCFLIFEYPMNGESAGERFVRAASYTPQITQGAWHQHVGGRVTINELLSKRTA